MDYQLARSLKDAGFPQKHGLEGILEDSQNPLPPYIPTLSELIEECGDTEFFDVIKYSDGWIASDHYMRGEGKNPSEAVANLYLALHDESPNK